jgi:cytochrome P450
VSRCPARLKTYILHIGNIYYPVEVSGASNLIDRDTGVKAMATEPAAPEVIDFDPFSDDFFNGPFATYRRLRDHAPVYHSERDGFWALSRYSDVAPAMRDHVTYSSAKGVTLDHFIDPNGCCPATSSS